jgi:hypothetical protein
MWGAIANFPTSQFTKISTDLSLWSLAAVSNAIDSSASIFNYLCSRRLTPFMQLESALLVSDSPERRIPSLLTSPWATLCNNLWLVCLPNANCRHITLLRPTINPPVRLGVAHPSGDNNQIFITVGGYGLGLRWGALCDGEDRPVVYSWYWTSPAQPVSAPSPSGLVKVFHASNSRLPQFGVSGSRIYIFLPVLLHRVLLFTGLRCRYSYHINTGSYWLQNQSYSATDGQWVSLSLCQAPVWSPLPNLYYCQIVAVLLMCG